VNGVHGARELGQNTIASGIRDAATMFSDQAIHLFAVGGQGTKGPGLVLAHQARITCYVCRKDRGQLALKPLLFRCHCLTPQ
jgi:hypothetical protein